MTRARYEIVETIFSFLIDDSENREKHRIPSEYIKNGNKNLFYSVQAVPNSMFQFFECNYILGLASLNWKKLRISKIGISTQGVPRRIRQGISRNSIVVENYIL